MNKFTTLKKEYYPQGEVIDKGYETDQANIVVELYYKSGEGYMLTANACTVHKPKDATYTSESTMLFQNGAVRMLIDNGRISKARTEKAIAYFEENKNYLVNQVLLRNPQY
jgi:hypothetical protein